MDAFSTIPAPFPSASMVNPCMENDTEEKRKGSNVEEEETMTCDNQQQGDWEKDSLSDSSDITESIGSSDLYALASSFKDSGSTMYKNGQYNEACAAYRNGLKKMKHITADADVTDASIQDLKLSMHLNISLCHYRQGQWNETIRACNEALALKNDNVKALFRRGVAYSRKGFLDEARSDLAKVCHKTPQDAQARGELKNVHDKLMQARQRDKKAFTGLFSKSGCFYEDREKEMEERKKKDAERLQQQKEEYTLENKKREEKGESPLPAFDVWQKTKTDNNAPIQQPPAGPATNTTSTPTPSNATKPVNTSSIHTDDFDEEDRKIMAETKKMGYCYFNRPAEPEINKSYATKTQPIRVETTNPSSSLNANSESTNDKSTSACSLSSWNNKGTTYEEKDCSTWVCKTLRDHLQGLCVSNKKELDINHLTKALEDVSAASKLSGSEAEPPLKALESFIHVLPWTCKVTSVDTVEGDAQIVVLRASKRYLYDLKIALSFTLTIPDVSEPTKDAACYHGTLSLEDVSTASSWSALKNPTEDTCQVDWLNDAKVSLKSSLSSVHEPIWKNALEALKKELYYKIQTFNELFHSYA